MKDARTKVNEAPPHRPFVLVHGTYHGGWCWQRLTPLLQAAGAGVYTPTLTGLGERSHLVRADTDVHTHIADVCNVIEWEGLDDVILVGHSYGGLVVSGIAHAMADRIARLVYLDSTHIYPAGDERYVGQPLPDGIVKVGPGGALCFPVPSDYSQWGVVDADDCRWLEKCLTPHPYLTKTDVYPVDEERLRTIPRTYIACLGRPEPKRPYSTRDWARKEPNMDYREMNTGHDAMVIAPAELAEVLLTVRDL